MWSDGLIPNELLDDDVLFSHFDGIVILCCLIMDIQSFEVLLVLDFIVLTDGIEGGLVGDEEESSSFDGKDMGLWMIYDWLFSVLDVWYTTDISKSSSDTWMWMMIVIDIMAIISII